MTDPTTNALLTRIKELEEALIEIAKTTKGYPNASREGCIAIKSLGDDIVARIFK